MKKIVLAMATAIMMATSVMAQDAEQKGERRQFNPEEMIQKRTDETVKKYGLDKDQAAKLLDIDALGNIVKTIPLLRIKSRCYKPLRLNIRFCQLLQQKPDRTGLVP